MSEDTPNAADSEHVIELIDVSKQFDDNVVYDHMDLSIRRGETLTIIGGSGQGKSVCMKMMIGLLTPDSGRVLVGGRDVVGLDEKGLREVRRRIAYVFQGGALFDSMTIEENVGYALREHTDLSDDEIRARVGRCLEIVGLTQDLLDAMPSNLSVGQRKRVAMARSIALEPEVILYDEPTTGLDPKNIVRIGDMIRKLQRELKVTSVVVTHDMPMAFKVSDRIAMLYERKFPYVGSPREMARSGRDEVRNFVHGHIEES